MAGALVVFTRDLRLRDHPALGAALRSSPEVLPLFVFDDRMIASAHRSANRLRFLLESLDDLRSSLRELGGDLFVRRGDWVDEVCAAVDSVGATEVHLSDDVSGYATRRLDALERALGPDVTLQRHPGVMVLPAGTTSPASGDSWKVFTPYFRKWLEAPWRAIEPRPTQVRIPADVEPGPLPTLAELTDADPSRSSMPGGETAALERLRSWVASSLVDYEDRHDDLAADETSRISPYLHFGCLSPLEVATRLRGRDGGAPFVRQLCWRDFYHQALAARPETSHQDFRVRGDVWRVDDDDAAAWREGRTGFPIVDAAMAQLREEGFMHNRARMVVASFLTKDLYLDWRLGAAHFMDLLLDGDVANNQLNWQWTAGTGTDTNPNRIFNPTVQSTRFDPNGDYIRRYVPALAGVAAPEIHDPDAATRTATGYPEPIVDHKEAIAAYREQLASYRSN